MVITNASTEILKLLLSNPKLEYNIREISKNAKINYRLAYNETHLLQKREILEMKRVGTNKLCRLTLNGDIPLFSYIESLRLKEKLRRYPQIKVIKTELDKIRTTYFTCILFGSYAKGKTTKKSDIDLLFIVPEKEKDNLERELNSLLSKIYYSIDWNIVIEKSFIEMEESSGLNVVNELIGNHIIIVGGENYYKLLSK